MPRHMADPAFRTEQQARTLTAPHIAPINALVDRIRDRDGRGWAPYVAPMHGGTDAEVLSVLRDPGPATRDGAGSGFLCVENDDPTAERQLRLFESVGISPSQVLPWNAYPWYVNRAPSASERDAGAAVIVELLGLLPNLRVVLLQGRDAEVGWRRVVRLLETPIEQRGISVVSTIHPGRQALFTPDPAERARRITHQEDAFREVGRLLREYPYGDDPNRTRAVELSRTGTTGQVEPLS